MLHDDFHVEPVRGLPEALPPGEVILWQGAPDPGRLAREAWKVRWFAGYFAALAVWRVGASSAGAPLDQALVHAGPILLAGAITCLILYAIAWAQAKATVYTLTNKRVALRIGAALTMTLNLPYVRIGSAGLSLHRDGTHPGPAATWKGNAHGTSDTHPRDRALYGEGLAPVRRAVGACPLRQWRRRAPGRRGPGRGARDDGALWRGRRGAAHRPDHPRERARTALDPRHRSCPSSPSPRKPCHERAGSRRHPALRRRHHRRGGPCRPQLRRPRR